MNELPMYWCVEATNNNWKVLFKWANFSWQWRNVHKYVTCNKTHMSSLNDNSSYTEISFETFEKLVLGINKETIYELW